MATLEAAFTGAVASSLANVVVYPLDLAKTLLQTQLKESKDEEVKVDKEDEYKNTVDCIWKVFRTRGVLGLYRGMSTSILGNFIQSFCYFFCYTFLRRYYYAIKLVRSKSKGKLVFSTAEELALGMAAAAGSQLFTGPVSVISTRQQTITSQDSNDTSATNIAKQILRENHGDVRAFWKGLKVSLVLTVNPSITYASYQKLKKLLFSVDEFTEVGLTARQNFILGALSKMISTLITQPLIVSKVSLQRAGSRFTNFQQVIYYLYKHEGILALWKGLRPQLAKGLLVQGLLFMFKGELTKALRRLLFLYSSFLVTRNKRLLL
ncbi:hypothetical protein HG536_0C02340 [Torulaspora globosa]|uniref:Uncharacterized protein n=1 Tax=Torulaspora globosa TaxID=48254 RepID=A0A7G3ZEX9_9SACH|nr:uncharacterized protein HG536_0C02340 [Torulaspora globosa]QLL32065.1 hypothetical protein HG536_0C02340 [Torulaspora globosa]